MEKLIEDFRALYLTLKELTEKTRVQHDELMKVIAERDEEKKALKEERKGVKKIKDVTAYEAEVEKQALANRRASASLATQQEEVNIECTAKQKKVDALLSEAKSIRDDVDAERGRLRTEVKKMEEAKKRYKQDVLDVLGNNKK